MRDGKFGGLEISGESAEDALSAAASDSICGTCIRREAAFKGFGQAVISISFRLLSVRVPDGLTLGAAVETAGDDIRVLLSASTIPSPYAEWGCGFGYLAGRKEDGIFRTW